MAKWILDRVVEGQSPREIADSYKEPKPSIAEVRSMIAKEKDKFESQCLKAVMRKAGEGDVHALEWLYEKGFWGRKIPRTIFARPVKK